MRDFLRVAWFLWVATQVGWAQVDGGGKPVDLGYDIIDGEVYLVGTFEHLDTIRVEVPESANARIIFDGNTLQLNRLDPFPGNTTVVPFESAREVSFGVLGATNAVALSGTTATSIRYSESLETAIAGDLAIRFGRAGSHEPVVIPIAPIDELLSTSQLGATIDDGRVMIVGEIERLLALNAISQGGYLSLSRPELVSDENSLFDVAQSVVRDEPNEFSISAISPEARKTVAGLIPSGISLLDPNNQFLQSGFRVSVQLGNGEPFWLPRIQTVPEPEMGLWAIAALGCLLLVSRQRRQ